MDWLLLSEADEHGRGEDTTLTDAEAERLAERDTTDAPQDRASYWWRAERTAYESYLREHTTLSPAEIEAELDEWERDLEDVRESEAHMSNETRRDVAYQGAVVGWVRQQHNRLWMGHCKTADIYRNRFNMTEAEAVRFVQRTHYDTLV